MVKSFIPMKLSFLILAVLILMNCNRNNSYKIGEVYLYKSEKGTFRVAKVIDINNDKIFVCIHTDTDIINAPNYGNCLDYGKAYENSYMNNDEKNDSLQSIARYKMRLPEKPTSFYNSIKVKEFSEMNPTYLKDIEITDDDKKSADNYWKRQSQN